MTTLWTEAMVDQLCELIENDDHTFAEISEIMGLTRDAVSSQVTRIRRHYESELRKRTRANGF